MALNEAALKAKIIEIQDEARQATDYATSKEAYANKMVLAFKEFLMSGTVTITGTVGGSPFTGTGTIS